VELKIRSFGFVDVMPMDMSNGRMDFGRVGSLERPA
jgi:hypothetical protein